MSVIIPERMPPGLLSRDPSAVHDIQTARPVRASALSVCEDAIAHLAGGRPLPVPATMARVVLTTSYQVWRFRFPAPLIPHWARIHGVITATMADTVSIRAARDGGGYVTAPAFQVAKTSAVAPILFDFDIEIGSGGTVVAASTYIDVDVEARVVSGVGTTLLHGLGIAPMPHYSPWSDPEVT